MIEARGIARQAPATEEHLLKPTDFRLAAGERVAVTGSSGSGKSVLLRTLALLDPLDDGQILWRGKPVVSAEIPQYRRHVCYIAQRPAMLDGTVEDNLRYPFTLKAYQGLQYNRDTALQLARKAGRDDRFLSKPASDLSGGEAQVAALIRVLQLDPDALLLDEPTASLDPGSAADIEALVTAWFHGDPKASRAYVWVSHDHLQAERMSTHQLTMRAGALSGIPA